MVKLRPYQRDLLRLIQDALDEHGKARVMMQLPTGGGKTVIAGGLLADWLTGGRKAVWLTHRRELAHQTRDMLTDAQVPAMTDVNWTPGADAPAMSHGVVILMAQTVGRRTAIREVWNRYNAGDLLVIDEAHHAAATGWERAMRQWPGPILGLTATPWRLSEKEGFDHLFDALLCGPQVAQLQADNWLCGAQTLMPPPEQRIIGGEVDRTGEFTELGIELANQDRPNVMTAGVLDFWRTHAEGRPTIAYAVSVKHALNLTGLFNNAGIPAAVILGDTGSDERDHAITGFRNGAIRVLVNVIVATEGFDLPDASCIVIARPTMSLALYLQMVGRGLRPKDDTCLILDLAANSVSHGLPEETRVWSLRSRGKQKEGEAPTVWCPLCGSVSPAASHRCVGCGDPLGKDCGRCGKWRAWKRWEYEDHCGDVHQLVCDLCHIDAHIEAQLPVIKPLDELIDVRGPEEGDAMENDIQIHDELASELAVLLKQLLDQERRSVSSADDKRRNELHRKIQECETALEDEAELERRFGRYLDGLPDGERPENNPQKWRMFGEWENKLKEELGGWVKDLDELEKRPLDKQKVFTSAESKVLHVLRRVAQDAGMLPVSNSNSTNRSTDGGGRGGPIGNDHLQDYLLPIIELMINGESHTEAFRSVAEKLKVQTSTAASQCTRGLGLNTEEFKEHVGSGRIVQILKNKFPERIELVNRELGSLYP